jgi:hypothetical protein
MSARYPSSGASRHLLPQGEKELLSSPSPLEGEGGSRRLTDAGAVCRTQRFAKQLRKDMTDAEKKLGYALRDRRFENFNGGLLKFSTGVAFVMIEWKARFSRR